MRLLMALLLVASTYPVRADVIGTVLSTQGEPTLEFVQRVGRLMRAWTLKTGYEACGMIAHTPDGLMGVVVETSREMATCTVESDDHPPPGWVMTQDDIHTHPERQRGRYSSSFSQADYAYPGYLVQHNRLWHQQGRGTEVDLGSLDAGKGERVAAGGSQTQSRAHLVR